MANLPNWTSIPSRFEQPEITTESARAAWRPGGLPFRTLIQERIAMHCLARRMWSEQDGVLSFEWTLLVTLLTIGIVSGLAGARDAIIDELGDAAQAMLALDDSFVLDQPLSLVVDIDGAGPLPAAEAGAAAGSAFIDAQTFTDCDRSPVTAQDQPGQVDSDS